MNGNTIVYTVILLLSTAIIIAVVTYAFIKGNKKERSNIIKEIDKYKNFGEGWDGGNGKVIDAGAIETAKHLIEAISALPEVMPSPLGGVCFEFADGSVRLLQMLILCKSEVIITEVFPDRSYVEDTVPIRILYINERINNFVTRRSVKEKKEYSNCVNDNLKRMHTIQKEREGHNK